MTTPGGAALSCAVHGNEMPKGKSRRSAQYFIEHLDCVF